MRIDLSDHDRLRGIAEALGRLFWCLMAVAFCAAILGSAGTGLFVLVLGAAAFVVRAGIEDFLRARGESETRATSDPIGTEREPAKVAPAEGEFDFTVYRSPRRRLRSAVKLGSR